MKLYVDIKAGQFECHGTIELGIKIACRILKIDLLFSINHLLTSVHHFQ